VFKTYPSTPNVNCCVCGQLWNSGDPRVLYRSLDHKWWCQDETECMSRAGHIEEHQRIIDQARADDLAAMYRALDRVWADLEAQGWRI
jgi:DNA-binding GntR family transcriptional regulator